VGHEVEGPRLFVILARDEPVAAVVRRGPSDWSHLGRWDLAGPAYEPGAWFHGTLYPQKCDLSPDGRWFAYSALKGGATWAAGSVYEAVSRLPWLHALAAWEAGTTYTRGVHFDDTAGTCDLGRPDVGDAAPILRHHGIRLTPATQFAVERRGGWAESAWSEDRDPADGWDERREVVMEKPRPGAGSAEEPLLLVEGSWAGHRSSPDVRAPARYALAASDEMAWLDGVQWADWSADGRLLVATTAGVLEIREVDGTESTSVWSHDVAPLTPDPVPPPDWARQH